MGFQGFFARLAQKISKTIPMSDTLGIKEIEETKFPKYILFIHSSLSHQRVAGVCALWLAGTPHKEGIVVVRWGEHRFCLHCFVEGQL